MPMRGSRVILAASLALWTWGCLAVLDFDGFLTSAPERTSAEASTNDAPRPDFILTPTPQKVSVSQGGESKSVSIAIDPLNGFADTVTLAVSGVPKGVTIDANGIAIRQGTKTATVTLSADTTAALGQVPITLSATAGTIAHTITIDVTIQGPHGTVDTTFGDAGVVITDLSEDSKLGDMLVEPNDAIVIGGGVGNATQKFVLARYTSNGHLDTSFGPGGTVGTATEGGAVASLALLPDGRLVAAITVDKVDGTKDTVVSRFLTTGDADPNFGSNGVISNGLIIYRNIDTRALLRRPSGTLVLVGTTGIEPMTAMELVQLQATGLIDTTFADAGVATHARSATVNGAALAADGTVVLAATLGDCSTTTFAANGTSPAGDGGAGDPLGEFRP
jgi:uncharacterized delta-60 repeat protein